ncbi:penicillin-binding protein 1A [Fulvivirga sedimenti]|uniref:Transglycosylase domain-containing protein n=1 Tax=Fulvivirga sedimenti TaxID=2879465 RepID=A0A9X1HT23_9BACT|nr:transglycosylase domain-containing protein [Fulvivirga sedimenti]MCA6075494.1 transglycosylase domain-containing protein [Fulvivirga sedimenti]MCA6076671.1 transglycosylase domain-containing protein [Fulvivirga sedimenti]MCA6077799.1 transglycosylase domain-containing protein [Fulvivirga sedimenti]
MAKRKLTPAQKRKRRKRPAGSTRRKNWKVTLLKFTLAVFFLGILAVGGLVFLVWSGAFGKLPTRDALSKVDNYQATEVYSADKVLLGRYYIQERTLNDYDEISENVINALIATEDVRFFEHDGVDYRSLFRVGIRTILLQDQSSGGGSTISQQLAKNLFPRSNRGRWYMPVIKIKEAIIAHRLEDIYSKEEILTLYLNTVPFGDNVYGIEMASRRFFNKPARSLALQEAAVLVGMLKANHSYNPRLYPERALERRNVVLAQMVKYGYIDQLTYDKLAPLPIELNYYRITHNTGLATYFREFLRPQLEEWCANNEKPDGSPYNLYTDGLKIYTTIDSKMQRYAENAVSTQMKSLQSVFDEHWNGKPWKNNVSVLDAALMRSYPYKNFRKQGMSSQEAIQAMTEKRPMKIFTWDGEKEVEFSSIDSVKHYLNFLQTGLLAMDPNKGDLRAWVGGINFEYFKYDHVNVNTRRQVGSTFKPFVYATALEEGIDPCTYISGEQIQYTNLANWTPGNADPSEDENKYSFAGALSKSVNTVSVKVLEAAGIDNTIELAKSMGIESPLPNVPSIALGTADISLLEMVTAYCSFANGGRKVEPRYLLEIRDQDDNLLAEFPYKRNNKDRVMSQETSAIMIELMKTVTNEGGTASRLRWKYGLQNDFAGKTGTTQSNADGWFIGFTRRLVVGAWVGADDPAIRFRSTALGQGANTALPIFASLFQQLNKDEAFRQETRMKFPPPSNRVMRMISCPPIKEDLSLAERLFGQEQTSSEQRERSFGEKPQVQRERTFFDKIGDIFKENKKKKRKN